MDRHFMARIKENHYIDGPSRTDSSRRDFSRGRSRGRSRPRNDRSKDKRPRTDESTNDPAVKEN